MRAIVGLLSLAVVCMTVLSVVNAVGEYSRTANYGNEMVVRWYEICLFIVNSYSTITPVCQPLSREYTHTP